METKEFPLTTVLTILLGLDKEFAPLSEETQRFRNILFFIIGGINYKFPWMAYSLYRDTAVQLFLDKLRGFKSIKVLDQKKNYFIEFSKLLDPLLRTNAKNHVILRKPRRGKEHLYEYLFKTIGVKNRFKDISMKDFRKMVVKIPILPSIIEFEEALDIYIREFNSKRSHKHSKFHLTRTGMERIKN